MKKFNKSSALIIALLMICLCLGGCDEIDQKREKHAVWTTKGSTESITFNGEEYILFSHYNEYDPTYRYTNVYEDSEIQVTNPDVPVLLSYRFGESMYMVEGSNFIRGSVSTHINKPEDILNNPRYYDDYEDDGSFQGYEEFCYCKSELYNELIEKINAGVEYTKYGFDYYNKYGDQVYYYFTDEENDVINKIIEAVNPKTSGIELNIGNQLFYIDKVSEDKCFGRKCYYEIYTLDEDTYCLVAPSYESYDGRYYIVPNEFNHIFKKLYDKMYNV